MEPARSAIGASGMAMFDMVGSMIPFARTRAEREKSGDPRPSIEERYASREEYLRKGGSGRAAAGAPGLAAGERRPEVPGKGLGALGLADKLVRDEVSGTGIARTVVLDCYDIPDQVFQPGRSKAFIQFLRNWFGDSRQLTRHELDLSFLREMGPDETQLARALLRRNLRLRYTHIIEGLAALHDTDAIPKLQEMLAGEPDLSRRLTLAGALWKLGRDPVFIDCLNSMASSDSGTLKAAHLHQVVWLDDERAIDFLIQLLNDQDRFVRFLALSTLNGLEFQTAFAVPEQELPRQPVDYRRRREEPQFRALMVDHLKARNRACTNGC